MKLFSDLFGILERITFFSVKLFFCGVLIMLVLIIVAGCAKPNEFEQEGQLCRMQCVHPDYPTSLPPAEDRKGWLPW